MGSAAAMTSRQSASHIPFRTLASALRLARAPAGLLQRCGGVACPPETCHHDEEPGLRRSGGGLPVPDTVPPIVHEVLRSPGQPLDTATRTFMEPCFGHDFSAIRIHTGQRASLSAAAVGARAYTIGRHIVMGRDAYQPASPAGRRLLAHELTHTIQQNESAQRSPDSLTLGDPNAAAEHEADRAAGIIVETAPVRAVAMPAGESGYWGQSAIPAGKSLEMQRTGSIQRKCVEDGGGVKHWKYEYDGCSLPAQYAVTVGGLTLGGPAAKDNPAGGGNTAFSSMRPTTEGGLACDRHDECYQSCATTKDQCDSRMYADMKEICAKASPYGVQEKCYTAAWIYYQGLKRLHQAQEAFDDRKKAVCSCDPKSLPPAERFPPLELLRSPAGGFLSWLDYQLSREKLVGYKVFRDKEDYEKYLHGGSAPTGGPAGRAEAPAP